MKDRIFNHWQSSLQGLIIALFALLLVIFKLATYTEVSGLFIISLILIFSKNNWLRKFFNKIPVILLVLIIASCSSLKHKESSKIINTGSGSVTDTSKFIYINTVAIQKDTVYKNIFFVKTDTIIKIDSLYFRIPVEKIIYVESRGTQKKDTVIIYQKETAIHEDTIFYNLAENQSKDKKGFNFWFLIIPAIVISLILILSKVIKKRL